MDRNCQGTPPSHPRAAGPPSPSPERFTRTVPSTRQTKKQGQKPHGSALATSYGKTDVWGTRAGTTALPPVHHGQPLASQEGRYLEFSAVTVFYPDDFSKR
jgi:hypothetical protein